MMPSSNVRGLRAQTKQGASAVLSDLKPLVYDQAPKPEQDVAPFVRAASAVRRWGSKVVVISDDTNAIAVTDEQQLTPVLLPQGEGGNRTFDAERGNKKHKLDLEASVVLPDGRLIAFGSGSTQRRERLVVLSADDSVRLVDGSGFYTQLRKTHEFAGAELNIEGALIAGDNLRLFQRGNGASVGGQRPPNAIGDMSLTQFVAWLDGRGEVPQLGNIAHVELGSIEGVPWTFTDAAVTRDGGVVFTAAAEASEDTFHDGRVYGSCFGVLGPNEVHVVQVCDASGQPLALKIEGIEPDPAELNTFSVVIDMDQPNEPALLGRLRVSGMGLRSPE